jgi:predicted ArsR family transcriptional regulator
VENHGPRPVRHDDALPGLSPARARVLEFLQSQAAPVGAEAVAAAFGQHVNTVRGHLDALVGDGLALRHRQGTSGRGRPAWYYRANPQNPEPDARVREYGALAGALAAHLIRTSPSPAHEARVAGVEWGRQIARERDTWTATPTNRTTNARTAVLDILADLGFSPLDSPGDATVLLRRCPLLDVARRYPDVVCQVHRGLIGGALIELGSEDAGVDLLPFAEPDACRLILPHVDQPVRT